MEPPEIADFVARCGQMGSCPFAAVSCAVQMEAVVVVVALES